MRFFLLPHPDAALHLSCSGSGLLHILDTSYGQGQGGFDPRTGVIHKGYCHSPVDVTGTACQGKASCIVSPAHIADPAGTGREENDPCSGVFKRTVVTYICVDHGRAHTIPTVVHPVPLEHSPEVALHEFVAPASLSHRGAPAPGLVEFFAHFFHKQQHSRMPFRGSRRGGAHGEHSCEADAHRLCGGVLKECVGDFSCPSLALCLTDQLPFLGQDCRAAHPCAPDVQAHCAGARVQRGDNGVVQCLAEVQARVQGHGAASGGLQPQCTELHPCLLDHSCDATAFDPAHGGSASAHAPILRSIPEYMGYLHAARAASQKAGDGVTEREIDLPFLHLVLPSVVRPGQQHDEQHGAEAEAAAETHADAAGHAAHAESDIPRLDKSGLGTGHMTPIVLAAHRKLVVNVDAREHPQDDRGELEANLWHARAGAAHQLFDLNHFGQVFWVHDPASHLHADAEAGESQEAHDAAEAEREHFCITAHVDAQPHRQVVSLPCVHEVDGNQQLANNAEARAQLWKYEAGLLHHLSSGLCLEHRPESVVAGSALQLSRCSSASAAQRWEWESGAAAERNPGVFDEHLARVEEHRRAFEEHKQQQAQISMHEVDAHQAHPDPNQHAYAQARAQLYEDLAPNGAEVADLRQGHEQLVATEAADHAADEAQIRHLERQVSAIAAEEHADRAAHEQDHVELAEEREQRIKLQREVDGDSERIHHLEMTLAAQRTAAAHAAASSDSEQTHFFTPTTLVLSVGLVAVLAAAFRKFVAPRLFTKRYVPLAMQEQHYYSSHAF